jgi:hypothetical protein
LSENKKVRKPSNIYRQKVVLRKSAGDTSLHLLDVFYSGYKIWTAKGARFDFKRLNNIFEIWQHHKPRIKITPNIWD